MRLAEAALLRAHLHLQAAAASMLALEPLGLAGGRAARLHPAPRRPERRDRGHPGQAPGRQPARGLWVRVHELVPPPPRLVPLDPAAVAFSRHPPPAARSRRILLPTLRIPLATRAALPTAATSGRISSAPDSLLVLKHNRLCGLHPKWEFDCTFISGIAGRVHQDALRGCAKRSLIKQ
ncbi:hypothetical protein ZWY2020_059050 [Hordeum vulgare]|nr:hypothetical protein ZWY2020_059050 [Hordeum vulgare]